jgi:hypothetical protein
VTKPWRKLLKNQTPEMLLCNIATPSANPALMLCRTRAAKVHNFLTVGSPPAGRAGPP